MTELNNRYVLHNKLLITFKMIFPTKEPNSVKITKLGNYILRDNTGEACLKYTQGLLTATQDDRVIFMCHVSSFSRFDNTWKIEQV